MKINWKKLAKSKGYLSLKEQRLYNTISNWKDKREAQGKFNWIICRAKHYAHHMGVSVDSILNTWEKDRDYSYNNYYQDLRMPKIVKNKVLKPIGIKGYRKSQKNSRFRPNQQDIKNRVCKFIMGKNPTKRVGKKARWSKRRKESGARRREYLKENHEKKSVSELLEGKI